MTDLLESIDLGELPENLDTVPTPFAERDYAPLRCGEPGCTNGVTKPARGRAPKYCDEHRKTATRKPGSPPAARNYWPRANEIEPILQNYVRYLGTGIKVAVNTVDGDIIIVGGPNIVHELCELARTDKRLDNLRTWLERAATPGKYGPLMFAVASVTLPIMANHGWVPQISTLAASSGKGE